MIAEVKPLIDELREYVFEVADAKKTWLAKKDYERIAYGFKELKDRGTRLMVVKKDAYALESVVLTVSRIYPRWALCYFECMDSFGNLERLPYTIHYSDVLANDRRLQIQYEGA